tara:strand:- start:326 stop:1084 length:759 start_codon:yes stop_codon:yes gene_type:complete
MAVNINSVYTTVLYILNKEQRGYITPAEFNSLAVQVQDEIFQAYFPDGNQLNRRNQSNSDNDTEFFNMFKDTSYKLHPFENDVFFTKNIANNGFIYTGSTPIFKLGEIMSTYSTTVPNTESVTQLASKKDYTKITRSKLTKPTNSYPICYTTNATIAPATTSQLLIKVSPIPDSLVVNCVLSPVNPVWSFTVGSLGQYIYNLNLSVNFELDISEQTNLIIGILKYCGIIIRDPEIVQAASQEAKQVEINEKS